VAVRRLHRRRTTTRAAAAQWGCFHSADSVCLSRARARRGVILFAAAPAPPDLTRVRRVHFSAKLAIGDQQARVPHPSHACNSRAVRNLRRQSLVGDSRVSDLLRTTSSALRDIARFARMRALASPATRPLDAIARGR
jgi:hypothetical protein